MTLAICSYVSNHAAVPLEAMLIKLMYEAVLMVGSPAEILNYANNLTFNLILKKIILGKKQKKIIQIA